MYERKRKKKENSFLKMKVNQIKSDLIFMGSLATEASATQYTAEALMDLFWGESLKNIPPSLCWCFLHYGCLEVWTNARLSDS